MSPGELLSWLPAMLVSLIIFSTFGFRTLVVYPRVQFSRISKRIQLYQNLRNGLYAGAGVLFIMLCVGVVGQIFIDAFPAVWKELWSYRPFIFNKFTGFITLVMLAYYSYENAFKTWLDDKIKTPKANWKAVRDIPIMFGLVAILIFPLAILTTENDGGLALHDAVIDNKIALVKSLLKDGAKINEQNENGFTPIMTAAYRGRAEIFSFLQTSGAKQNHVVKSKHKNFHYQGADLYQLALKGGSLAIVKNLFTPDKVNQLLIEDTASPLHFATVYCHEEVVDFLIDQGADVNKRNSKGKTPLHKAAESSCFSAVASLLEAGADPLIKDKYNKLAYEYGRKGKRQPAAYLERKTLKRLPRK